MTPAEFHDEVVLRVVAIHGDKPWFRGVCVDQHYPNVEAATEAAELDTWYWDGMNYNGGKVD